jgi:DMSO/TMAO reductase YedYZ molybdopterin-dependent catalytic subunit
VAGRRTNLALLGLLVASLITGGLAFAIGTAPGRWVVAAHGVVGLAIVALAPWKSVIVRRGLARARPGTAASLVFLLFVVVALVAGVLHGSGLVRDLGPITMMQLHVGAALVSIPLLAWHLAARRVRAHHTDVARRQLLRSGALLAGAGVSYAALEGLLRVTDATGAARRFTGSYETGSHMPDAMPVTQWLNDRVRVIDNGTWRLEVTTASQRRAWGLEELEGFDDRARALLDCTGGWWAQQEWEGVLLHRVLGNASGRSISVTSVTGYQRRLPLRDAHTLLLATRMGGAPLSAGHGAPVRLVAPGRRGFWWVKWVVEITVDDVPWWLQPPFPLT